MLRPVPQTRTTGRWCQDPIPRLFGTQVPRQHVLLANGPHAVSQGFPFTRTEKGVFSPLLEHPGSWTVRSTYVGPIPSRDYFDPDRMAPARKADFKKWHAVRVAENYQFNYREELLAYCQSDMWLLKEGCQKFQKEFQPIAEFDPLEHCVTIASECNRFFRKHCLTPGTIASEPLRGWHNKRKPYFSRSHGIALLARSRARGPPWGHYPGGVGTPRLDGERLSWLPAPLNGARPNSKHQK